MKSKMRVKDLSNIAYAYYGYLDDRKWKDAEASILNIQKCLTNKSEEWMTS